MALCACGCGTEAGIYKSSFLAQGIVAGQPKKYVRGHAMKNRRFIVCRNGHPKTPDNRLGDSRIQWKCLTCHRNATRRNYYKDVARSRARRRRHCEKKRRIVLAHYGGACRCCGETRIQFLAIDHIAGGGNQHRKLIKTPLTAWLYRNGFPPGFRVLCHNCNFAIGAYKACPHGNLDKEVA